MTTTAHKARERDGLTLIEVMLVIAVMAVLVGLAIPSATPAVGEQLRSAASIVAADLDYARSLAVTYGSDYRLTFDTTNHCYLLEHVGANASLDQLPRDLFGNMTATTKYEVSLAELPTLGPEVCLAAAARLDGNGDYLGRVDRVVFGPLGETNRSEPTRIWLSAGSGTGRQTVSVLLNPVTGMALVEALGEYPLPETIAEPAI